MSNLNEYIKRYISLYGNKCYQCNESIDDLFVPCPIAYKPPKIVKKIITKDNTIQRFSYNTNNTIIANIDNDYELCMYTCEHLFHDDCCLKFIKDQTDIKYMNSYQLYTSLIDDMINVRDITIYTDII